MNIVSTNQSSAIHFWNSPWNSRRAKAWVIGAMLAVLVTVAQPTFDSFFGTDLVPTASACQTQGGTGDC